MTNLTQNEIAVLKAAAQDFNYDTAEDEKSDNAAVFTIEELCTRTGKAAASVKGIVGSLFKKDLLCEMSYGSAHENMGIGWTDLGIDTFYAMADKAPVPEETKEEEDLGLAGYFKGMIEEKGKCAALRMLAATWIGTRKEFLTFTAEAGINKGTASRQWQEGRNE